MSPSSRRLLILLLALLSACSMEAAAASPGASRSVAARERYDDSREKENVQGLFSQRQLQDPDETDLILDEESHTESPLLDEEDGHTESEEDGHTDEEEGGEILKEKPWGEVLVASLIINLVSLVGLVFVVAGVATKKWCKNRSADSQNVFDWKFTTNMIPSFACGALIATTCFLIVPEALEMIHHFVEEKLEAEEGDHEEHRWLEEHEEEEEEHGDTDAPTAWRFGTSFICGFLLPVLSSVVFPHHHEPEICDNCQASLDDTEQTSPGETRDILNKPAPETSPPVVTVVAKHEKSSVDCHSCELQVNHENHGHEHHDHHHDHHDDDGVETDESIDSPPRLINYSLVTSILIGDFFHNFTDGVLLGTAFSICHRDLAITISVATIYHELAQEVADFFLLTKHCNLRVSTALFLNFIGGLSIMLGAVLVLAFDITEGATGCILAVGAGVYVYVAAAECLPRAKASQTKVADKVISLVSFVVGVVPIGLVLLNHGHCEG